MSVLEAARQCCKGLAAGAALILIVHALTWLAANVEPVPALLCVLFVAVVGWAACEALGGR